MWRLDRGSAGLWPIAFKGAGVVQGTAEQGLPVVKLKHDRATAKNDQWWCAQPRACNQKQTAAANRWAG
jgi:hypothetical protein